MAGLDTIGRRPPRASSPVAVEERVSEGERALSLDR